MYGKMHFKLTRNQTMKAACNPKLFVSLEAGIEGTVHVLCNLLVESIDQLFMKYESAMAPLKHDDLC